MLDVAYAHGTVPTIRRSKTLTLRSRAAQALRSIKNVGKAPRRPALDQVFPTKENEQPAVKTEVPMLTRSSSTVGKRRAKSKDVFNPTHTSTPRLKKRNSQPLTNVFGIGGSESELVAPSAPDTGHQLVLAFLRASIPFRRLRTFPLLPWCICHLHLLYSL